MPPPPLPLPLFILWRFSSLRLFLHAICINASMLMEKSQVHMVVLHLDHRCAEPPPSSTLYLWTVLGGPRVSWQGQSLSACLVKMCACVCVQGDGGPQGGHQQRGAACQPAGAALGRLPGAQSQLSRRPLQHSGQPCLSFNL